MFNQMRQVPEHVAEPWHGKDEVPRYLAMMQAVKTFNDAEANYALTSVRWEAEEQAENLFAAAEGTLLRTLIRGYLFALVAVGVGVGAALLHLYVGLVAVALVLVGVAAAIARAYKGWRAEQAARAIVVKARDDERKAIEKHIAELREAASGEVYEAERKIRVVEPVETPAAPPEPQLPVAERIA